MMSDNLFIIVSVKLDIAGNLTIDALTIFSHVCRSRYKNLDSQMFINAHQANSGT